MGCVASSDRAERWRRGRARGYSDASTAGLLVVGQDQEPVPATRWRRRGCNCKVAPWRRRGCCKVAPEPKEQGDQEPPEPKEQGDPEPPEPKEQGDPERPEPAMPGSPSFRYYCHNAAAIDALVAETEASDGDRSIRIRETSEAPKTNKHIVEDKIVEVPKPKHETKWLRFRGLAIVAAAWFNLFRHHRNKDSGSAAAAKSHPPGPAPAPAAAARSHA